MIDLFERYGGIYLTYFGNVAKIQFEGKHSNNPLAFKFYNPEEIIAGKTMEEHLRFSIAYWHAFTANWIRSIWRANE